MSAPIFEHRFEGDLSSNISLTDTISMMAFRAKGVLQLVTINLEAEHQQATDEIVLAAIYAAIAEIEDINTTMQAHHAAVMAKGGL